MTSGTVDVIAPSALIVPTKTDTQTVSGAMWVSGADLFFFPSDGSNAPKRMFISGAIWANDD